MKRFLLVLAALISHGFVNIGYSTPLQPLDDANIHLAVGTYVEFGPTTRPMLLTSNNNAKTWLFNNWVLPNNAIPIEVTCLPKLCFLISDITKPYSDYERTNVYATQDHGQSWMELKMTPGLIYSVNCTSTLCVAVGTQKKGNEYIPMITLSNDDGNTWSQVKNIQNLPETSTAELTKVTCSDNYCIAVGNQIDTILPIFIISSDSGKTWTFVKDISGLPSNIEFADSIEHIKCIKSTCVAAGTYIAHDNQNPMNSHTLLLVSHDGGKSWRFIKEIPTINNMTFLFIKDLIISNGSFIIVGGYGDTGLLKALILTSDDGDSWTLIDKVAGTDNSMGWLKSVSCVEDTCLTTGDAYYAGGIGFGQTLLISKDNGKSWALIPYTPNTPYAPDFDAIQCAGTTCVAMGAWADGGDYSHPVFLVSKDMGQSWTTVKNNISNFPQNIFEVHFLSIHE